jgi:hypothetical protein
LSCLKSDISVCLSGRYVVWRAQERPVALALSRRTVPRCRARAAAARFRPLPAVSLESTVSSQTRCLVCNHAKDVEVPTLLMSTISARGTLGKIPKSVGTGWARMAAGVEEPGARAASSDRRRPPALGAPLGSTPPKPDLYRPLKRRVQRLAPTLRLSRRCGAWVRARD